MYSNNAIKLISLNIERDQHYDTVFPFLRAKRPDVVCLQEVLDRDVERFKKEFCMNVVYAPIAVADRGRGTEALAKAGIRIGTALFSRLPFEDSSVSYYCGAPEVVPSAQDPLLPSRHKNSNGVFIAARVRNREDTFNIGTTHFTWTPDGSVSEGQRHDLRKLLEILSKFTDIVFCGDFNAPRGMEIWSALLAARYRDNIPLEYKTSIDQNLHKMKGIMYVVDGLFSTPHYRCLNTKLVDGVSDHCAIVSTISRVR